MNFWEFLDKNIGEVGVVVLILMSVLLMLCSLIFGH